MKKKIYISKLFTYFFAIMAILGGTGLYFAFIFMPNEHIGNLIYFTLIPFLTGSTGFIISLGLFLSVNDD